MFNQNAFWAKFIRKESPSNYQKLDKRLDGNALGTKELTAIGVGTVVGAAIFIIPGVVAANYAGPAVAISFIIAAIVAGLSALAYAEFSSALPFAGSAYTWSNIIYGEFFGWVAGWALLAEYLIALAYSASAWSAYIRGFLSTFGITIPKALTSTFAPKTGTYIDLFAIIAVLLVWFLLSRGIRDTAKVENWLVVGKIIVIILFIAVGMTAIHPDNFHPFIPKNEGGTRFGWSGIVAGASQIFFAYIGFDMMTSNAAEAKNAQKTVPRAIFATLGLATALFIGASLVMVGMFKYTKYATITDPAAWALRQTGHVFVANLLSIVALVGIFSMLIGVSLGGSRLMYALGRDGLLPKQMGQVNKAGTPHIALSVLAIVSIILGAIFPITMLTNLVSAGTLIAFIMISFGVLILRRRKDIDHSGFKMPLYPVLPVIAGLASMMLFWQLNVDAKILAAGWFFFGVIIYVVYGIRHSIKSNNVQKSSSSVRKQAPLVEE